VEEEDQGENLGENISSDNDDVNEEDENFAENNGGVKNNSYLHSNHDNEDEADENEAEGGGVDEDDENEDEDEEGENEDEDADTDDNDDKDKDSAEIKGSVQSNSYLFENLDEDDENDEDFDVGAFGDDDDDDDDTKESANQLSLFNQKNPKRKLRRIKKGTPANIENNVNHLSSARNIEKEDPSSKNMKPHLHEEVATTEKKKKIDVDSFFGFHDVPTAVATRPPSTRVRNRGAPLSSEVEAIFNTPILDSGGKRVLFNLNKNKSIGVDEFEFQVESPHNPTKKPFPGILKPSPIKLQPVNIVKFGQEKNKKKKKKRRHNKNNIRTW